MVDDLRKVRIGNEVMFYKEKAPFVTSGKSIKGALEFDDVSDLVKCHECGEWFKALPAHVLSKHSLSAHRYKAVHGLGSRTSLVCESTRLKLSARAKRGYKTWIENGALKRSLHKRKTYTKSKIYRDNHELRNIRKTCHLQLLNRLRNISKALGRTPSHPDLREHGISPDSVKNRFGSLAKAWSILKLPLRDASRPLKYNRKMLSRLLRNFTVTHGRRPTSSDCRRGYLPNTGAFVYHFGSWNKAVKSIGFSTAKGE